MKKNDENKGAAEFMAEIAAMQSKPGSKVETMPEKFYEWLCETLQADVTEAQKRLARAVELREQAEKIRKAAGDAFNAAITQEGPFGGPLSTETGKAFRAASVAWTRAREVEAIARIHGRDCLLRLTRAKAGIPQAQAMIVENWHERPLLSFDIDSVTTADVREARDKPGVAAVSVSSRLRGVVNSWLGRAQ